MKVSNDEAVASLSFFRFSGWRNRWWAFKQMRLALQELRQVPGVKFVKLMGSGAGNGFSWKPDLSVYALLICWQDIAYFQKFKSLRLYRNFDERSTEKFDCLLKAYQQHGSWEGQKLFGTHRGKADKGLTAVLTRASIKTSRLIAFWRDVPPVSRSLSSQPGLLFSKGVGEWPLIELTTFSIWENEESMQQFAYGNPSHQKAMKDTRTQGFFSEELFARFEVVSISGSWDEKDLTWRLAKRRASH